MKEKKCFQEFENLAVSQNFEFKFRNLIFKFLYELVYVNRKIKKVKKLVGINR